MTKLQHAQLVRNHKLSNADEDLSSQVCPGNGTSDEDPDGTISAAASNHPTIPWLGDWDDRHEIMASLLLDGESATWSKRYVRQIYDFRTVPPTPTNYAEVIRPLLTVVNRYPGVASPNSFEIAWGDVVDDCYVAMSEVRKSSQ